MQEMTEMEEREEALKILESNTGSTDRSGMHHLLSMLFSFFVCYI
jgi:hypothetical protein